MLSSPLGPTPTISQSMAKALVSLVGNQGSRLTPWDLGPSSATQQHAEDWAQPDTEATALKTPPAPQG